jgi:PKHD-type hydroxylase
MTVFALEEYRGRRYPPFAVLEVGLSETEVATCIQHGDALPRREATVAQAHGSVVDTAYRAARVGWLYPGRETRMVFDLLARVTEKANAFFGFSLLGFAEPVQYTVYEAPSVGYEWHVDMVDAPTEVQRKLSLTLQLSDPADYEGGALEFRDGCSVVTAPRERGAVVAFPSWAHHRVTPVTRGVRRSLVAWVGGPCFR